MDGTPSGFYWNKATDPTLQNNWVIYFQGGGWCYSEADCWGRSKGALGSSKSWPNTTVTQGMMSLNCTTNPDFCGFNIVYLAYCDGDSFAGDRDTPMVYEDDQIWFRGRRNVDAVMKYITTNLNFGQAQQVLLTGCSAGGLATYLHTDYITSYLPSSVTKYKAVPMSGYFLFYNNVENKPVYPDEIKKTVELADPWLPPACLSTHSSSDAYKCNFAQETYRTISANMFLINSFYDSWQTDCVLTSETPPVTSTTNGFCGYAPGWKNCSSNPEQCTDAQMIQLNAFGQQTVSLLNATPKTLNDGEGGFIHSCHTHCEAQYDQYWNTITVNGVSLQSAVSLWWHSTSDPAKDHWYFDCFYNAKTKPRACNPTCAKKK
jgi:hypothetical protein